MKNKILKILKENVRAEIWENKLEGTYNAEALGLDKASQAIVDLLGLKLIKIEDEKPDEDVVIRVFTPSYDYYVKRDGEKFYDIEDGVEVDNIIYWQPLTVINIGNEY